LVKRISARDELMRWEEKRQSGGNPLRAPQGRGSPVPREETNKPSPWPTGNAVLVVLWTD